MVRPLNETSRASRVNIDTPSVFRVFVIDGGKGWGTSTVRLRNFLMNFVEKRRESLTANFQLQTGSKLTCVALFTFSETQKPASASRQILLGRNISRNVTEESYVYTCDGCRGKPRLCLNFVLTKFVNLLALGDHCYISLTNLT